MIELRTHQNLLLASLAHRLKRSPYVFAALVIALLSWACQPDLAQQATVQPPGTYPIAPIFREFYNLTGGEQVFGLAIAPALEEGYTTTQFLETGKMIFDDNSPIGSKFRMAPLGVELGIREPPAPPPDPPDEHYVDGHNIPPDFYLLYKTLGARLVGKPLTEPQFNLIRRRYEQYFENLGFYRLEGTSEVRLLFYGVLACGEKCGPNKERNYSIPDIPAYTDPAFYAFVEQYGADFTGFAQTEAYLNSDGNWEQIFRNLVLVADSQEDPQEITLQPLSSKLSLLVETPLPPVNLDFYFYAVEGVEKGYEVPQFFMDYIEKHGGLQLFGPPISHYSLLMYQIYHQCFQNLCLTRDPALKEGAQVRPEPLGYAYKVLYYTPPSEPLAASTATAVPTYTAVPTGGRGPQEGVREISLRVWQRFLVMEQKQGQEIDIWVYENEQPAADVVVELTVMLPDASEQVFQMPPTDAAGQTSLLLPEIQALNGTIVPFKACYTAEAGLRFCIADIYVIWNIP